MSHSDWAPRLCLFGRNRLFQFLNDRQCSMVPSEFLGYSAPRFEATEHLNCRFLHHAHQCYSVSVVTYFQDNPKSTLLRPYFHQISPFLTLPLRMSAICLKKCSTLLKCQPCQHPTSMRSSGVDLRRYNDSVRGSMPTNEKSWDYGEADW